MQDFSTTAASMQTRGTDAIISFNVRLDAGKENGRQIWEQRMSLKFTRFPDPHSRTEDDVMDIAVAAADILKATFDKTTTTKLVPDIEGVRAMIEEIRQTVATVASGWECEGLIIGPKVSSAEAFMTAVMPAGGAA